MLASAAAASSSTGAGVAPYVMKQQGDEGEKKNVFFENARRKYANTNCPIHSMTPLATATAYLLDTLIALKQAVVHAIILRLLPLAESRRADKKCHQ